MYVCRPGAAFTSPVYVAVSTHWPSQCVDGSCFPFHTWDTTCGFETWEGSGLSHPTAADRSFGQSVRRVWRGLAFDGKLAADLPPVNGDNNNNNNNNNNCLVYTSPSPRDRG